MGLLDYERRFASLRMNAARGRVSPHKVAMLLAVIDNIEAGTIKDNRIFFSQSLRNRFTEHFKRLAGPADRDNPHLPFFHLRSEGFWHHRIKPAKRANYDQLSTASSPHVIAEHIEYAFLDDELFELLGNTLVAELLRTSLMQNLDEGARSDILRRKSGWDWLECEMIIKDYLEMLQKELQGIPYSKTDQRRALQSRLNNRSNGSIEYKHQNISAVLLQIGLPYIPGYKPAFNYQHQLKQAVLAHIARKPSDLDDLIESAASETDGAEIQDLDWTRVLDPNPPERLTDFTRPDRLYLARTSNFSEREQLNRSLGESGERFALRFEKNRLISAGREDLAREVEWSSEVRGDGLGYDIRSFDPKYERELFVEVKTTNSGKYQPFFLSENERAFSNDQSGSYCLYRIYEFKKKPRLFMLAGAVEQHAKLLPQQYRATFDP